MINRLLCSRRCVVNTSSNLGSMGVVPFAVGIGEIALEVIRKLSQIVPQTGELAEYFPTSATAPDVFERS